MHEDAYGLPLTTVNEAAAAAFRVSADRLLAAVGDPLAAADAAVREDPDMALAHSARAMALLFRAQPQAARQAAEEAVRLARSATRRERQHAAIILDVVAGRRDAGLAKIREHVKDFPRDALAINPAAGVFGLIGFSGRKGREAEQVALLAPLAEHYGDDWWYQHVLAFALLEHDAVDRALPLVASALSQRPDSGHVAHTWVHALFEANQHARAVAWLDDWAPTYSPDGVLYCHLWWHLALFHLHQREFEKMWAIYDTYCRHGQSASLPINLFTDGVSLAWRAMVAGAERPLARLEALRALGEEHFPKPGIFVDVHRAACLAALGQRSSLAAFRDELNAALAAGTLGAGAVVLEIVDGFAAFCAEDWPRARDILVRAQPEVVRIGGSRAQRRIVSETLAAAAARSAGWHAN